jgi:glycosyltransferase involved in cell wall biosynthesis
MQLKEKKKHIKPQETPLVSIITPLYNAASYIAQTITSIAEQRYTNWEHIIVDDGSTDTSVAIVRALAKKDPRIKLSIGTKNNGAAFCRNKATALAQGKYIAFLDADDLWHPEKLERQITFMQQQQCDVSYTSYIHINAAGKPLQKRIKALAKLSYQKQHSNNYIGNLTGLYNCETLGKIIAPNIRKRQDWAVWLEAIQKSGKPALGLQEDLGYYRVHESSMSANKFDLVKYNYAFYNQYLGYSKIASGFYLLRFFWEYFINRPKQIEEY